MPGYRDQRMLLQRHSLKTRWNMIRMQNAITTVILTRRGMRADIIMVKTVNAGTIMEKASTAAMKRATKAVAVVTASKAQVDSIGGTVQTDSNKCMKADVR